MPFSTSAWSAPPLRGKFEIQKKLHEGSDCPLYEMSRGLGRVISARTFGAPAATSDCRTVAPLVLEARRKKSRGARPGHFGRCTYGGLGSARADFDGPLSSRPCRRIEGRKCARHRPPGRAHNASASEMCARHRPAGRARKAFASGRCAWHQLAGHALLAWRTPVGRGPRLGPCAHDTGRTCLRCRAPGPADARGARRPLWAPHFLQRSSVLWNPRGANWAGVLQG